MEILNKLITKVGRDKLEHHIFGSWICSLLTMICILQDGVIDWSALGYPVIGSASVLFLQIIKERAIDEKADWKDTAWTMAGCIWVFLAIAIGVLFNQLSN